MALQPGLLSLCGLIVRNISMPGLGDDRIEGSLAALCGLSIQSRRSAAFRLTKFQTDDSFRGAKQTAERFLKNQRIQAISGKNRISVQSRSRYSSDWVVTFPPAVRLKVVALGYLGFARG